MAKKDNQDRTLQTLATLFTGVAAGTVLGILLAPDKGEETRKKIGAKAREWESDAEKQLNDRLAEFREKSRNTTDDIRKQTSEFFDHLSRRWQEALGYAEQAEAAASSETESSAAASSADSGVNNQSPGTSTGSDTNTNPDTDGKTSSNA
jgi:gas vesicle protein